MKVSSNLQARFLQALIAKLAHKNKAGDLLMKRTIFIPIDFSEASLHLIEHALLSVADDEAEIVLTHCFFLTDSIVELLFFE
ncbi:hypothetical protein VZ94_09610 [Methylocucumis oryzae]|uniref:Uncharacterized protein n=2 Tax=Methylocucumis oryzae TaxID=1632867 RepID=A0A0F3IJK7_9GAMM|nr:hypothetical protein VZ94_09610 [Methylocucumis oryzae]